MPPDILIRRLIDIPDAATVVPGVDAVFFDASNTKSFAEAEARAVFRERWLGRYLTHDPQWFYVAFASDGGVAGYLSGCLDDPARASRFSDIAYFAVWRDLTRQFPAHLHVNLAPQYRGSGAGSALVARFVAEAADGGAPGVHVVTSRGARNVRFYERNGFTEHGAFGAGAREVVLLARKLGRSL